MERELFEMKILQKTGVLKKSTPSLHEYKLSGNK
jgi:hypothetical protein